LIRYFAIAQSD